MPLSSCAVPTVPRGGIDLLTIGIRRDRETLYRRIDERTEAMFSLGLADEVKKLMAAGFGPDDPGMKAIGYREFFEMERSGCMTISDVIELVKRRSRNYAKRQLTFFASLPGVHWFDADDETGVAHEIGEFVEQVFSA
jgi:tRNA dimethylallyltransferase